MRGIQLFFWISILLLFTSFIQKEPKNRVRKYTNRNGFPLKTLKSVTQDKEGLMWFAAEDGLARFDGNSFQLFKNDPDNSHSLSSNYTQWVFSDSEGIVWVCSSKGLSRFDLPTERFSHYRHHPTDNNSLVGDNVVYMTENTGGNLWIASAGAGFTYFDKKKAKFIQYSQNNLPGLSSPEVILLYEDPQGLLWVGSLGGGLDVFQTKDGILIQKIESLSRKNLLPSLYVRCLSPDHMGNIWIGTNEGLVFYNRKLNTFEVLNTHNSALRGNTIRSLQEDSKHNLWIGVEDKGLHQIALKGFDGLSLTTLSVKLAEGEEEYLIYKHTIHAIYEDRDRNLWLATNGGGMQMISGIPEKFTRIQRKQTGEYEGTYLRFWGMCSDQEGNLWLGSDGDGIYQYNQKGDLLKHYYADGKKGSLTDNAILSAYRDHTNTLWFGTYAQGLFRYDKKTDSFINYKHDPDNPASLGSNDVRVIFEDSKHNLWVGCNGGGLNLLNQSTGTFTKYASRNSKANSGSVRAIIEDRRGGLWVGCHGDGVQYFDPKKKKLQRYFNGPESKNALASDIVYALYQDSQGKLWMGTAGTGLAVYDPEKQTSQYFDEKKGLGGSSVYALLADRAGNLWMSTNAGVSKWNPSEQQFYNYDGLDGLQNGQFNSSSFLYDPDSDLMGFAGTEGVTLFHPGQVKQNLQPPPVMITGFQLFNQPVPIHPAAESEPILKQAISQTKEIRLKYNQSVFTFEFTALHYAYPEKCAYAYQMVDFDKEWNYVGSKRSATYTNLDPGEYIFRVKATNNDGVWNEQGTSIKLIITPPYWQTWWFRTCVACAILGSAFGFYRYRMNVVKAQKVELEKQVVEKTRQLQSANEELLTQEEEIKAQNEELSLRNDELFNRQDLIAIQRDLLLDQNEKLRKARQIIEDRNQEVLLHNQVLDQEVKERTRELMEYNQQLEQFAFIAAHNLRAPVARILGLGQVLDLTQNSPAEERTIVKNLTQTAQELDMVVKDISQILQIRKDHALAISEINLSEELRMIKANLEDEIAKGQVTIREEFSAVMTIRTVKPYLDSILMNLIHNAIKYRAANRKPVIQIKTENAGKYTCLIVKDNGMGIDLKKHQYHLFSLYKRFHFHVEGKGMGLHMVKTQVIALGGRIEVESQVNRGTTFKVYFKNEEPEKRSQNLTESLSSSGEAI
jgi:ligand-binding sensor domain-containing protein/signal transduction histidine kinase